MRHLDKLYHAAAGVVVFALAMAAGAVPGVALAWTVAAGIGKELHDLATRHKNTPDALDALATIAPGVVLFGVVRALT